MIRNIFSNQNNSKESILNSYYDFLTSKLINADYDYIIVIARRGYLFTEYVLDTYDVPQNIKEKFIPHRVCIDSLDGKFLCNKKICLLDDIVNCGVSMKKLYCWILEHCSNVVVDIASYYTNYDVNLKALLKTKQKNGRGSKKNIELSEIISANKFKRDIWLDSKSHSHGTINCSVIESSNFALHEMYYIHKALKHYTVDLPIMPKIKLAKEQFDDIVKFRSPIWQNSEYEFQLHGEKFHTLIYNVNDNKFMEEYKRLIESCLIVGRYNYVGNEIEVAYFPFVVLKSCDFKYLEESFLKLFSEIKQLDTNENLIAYYHKIKKLYTGNNWAQEAVTFLSRSVIYLISYILGKQFCEFYSSKFGISLQLNPHLIILPAQDGEYHSNELLVNYAKHIWEKNYKISPAFFTSVFHSFTPYDNEIRSRNHHLLGDINYYTIGRIDARNQSYERIYKRVYTWLLMTSHAMHDNKRKEDSMLLHDNKRRIDSESLNLLILGAGSYRTYLDYEEVRNRITTAFINSGIMSHDLYVEDGKFTKGYSLGELMEMCIPYDYDIFGTIMRRVYRAIIKGASTENKEKALGNLDRFKLYYRDFMNDIAKYLTENKYFAYDLIDDETYLFWCEYFNPSSEPSNEEQLEELYLQVYNKRSELFLNEECSADKYINLNKYYLISLDNFVRNLTTIYHIG